MSLLHNHIDTTRVPFSDRGSRLLVYSYSEKSGFYVKLAERLTQLDADNEVYLQRDPFIQDLILIDADGHPLEIRIDSSPYRLEIHTQIGDFELLFKDIQTIAFGLPANITCGFSFRVFPQYWHNSSQGGKFVSVRNLVYTTTGEVISNVINPVGGGFQVEFMIKTCEDCTATIDIYPGDRYTSSIEPFSILRSAAEKRWRDWFNKVPEVQLKYARTYAYAWWVMANNLISPLGKVMYEAMTPSKIGYVGLWLWDSALHALAYRYIDPDLARNQIRSMIAHQLPNGMMPDAIFDTGVVTSIDHPFASVVTKPPILTWAVLKLHETDPDNDFLEEVYMPLVRLNAWWFSMNDDDGDGLIQYNHPYSSGLDDSPLWDKGMPVESPDLNTYLCINMKCLATIAEILQLDSEAAMWRRKATSMVKRMIKHFWDPKSGLFWALKDHKKIKIVTPFNLYPLWTGLLPEEIKNRLIKNLTNPNMFWGKYMLPTVAKNDPKFNPQKMWRGPVWANINYFFIEALQLVGEKELAYELREKTLDIIMAQTDMYEFYDAETGSPPPKAVNIFGWTSAVFIDLAIQATRELKEKEGVSNEN